jgi:hypothetical protein
MDHLAIDLKEYPISTRGNKQCLVIVDICSRFVWLHAILDKEASTVAKAMWCTISQFGFPKIIQSDNGKKFVNKVFDAICRISKINHRLITPYHARANCAAERMVETTSQAVYKVIEGRTVDSDLHLPSVQLFINMKISRRHGSTPYSLMFARQPNQFVDHSQVEPKPQSEEELLKRLDYMTMIVYPSIHEKTKGTSANLKNTIC